MRTGDWIFLGPVFLRYWRKLPSRHLLYLAGRLRNENPHRHRGKLYVNSFFPPFPSVAFERFLDLVVERKRVPFSTYFAVTDSCPYKCPHCSYGHHKKGSIKTKEALEVIEQIKSLGTTIIGFTGGEPLLRDDIVELVEAVGDETFSIIFTTGHRLDGELAKRLSMAGLGCLMIGVESDDESEHDRTRGVKGSFKEALVSIRASLDAGLYTAISTVATHDKIASGALERLAELGQRCGVHELRVLEPAATGGWQGKGGEVLSAEESRQVADFHKRWNRRGRGPAVASFSYLESEEMFGCGAGFHHLFIDALGNVCPCDLTPLSFGNVMEEPLSEIWARMGDWFDLPRVGCFVKEICSQLGSSKDVLELPLAKAESAEMCRANKRGDKLPRVYQNLFRGRAGTNRELNREQSE